MNIRTFIDRYSLSAIVYFFIAVASALVEWASFYSFEKAIGAIPAALAAFLVATPINYLLSRQFAFHSKRSSAQEFSLTLGLSALAFAFNFAVFVAIYKLFDAEPLVAKILGTGCGFAMNFLFRQFIIFSSMPRFAAASEFLVSRSAPAAVGPQAATSDYAGRRILEAMRNAPRYADAVYAQARAARPARPGPILDFGAGDGMFVEKFLAAGVVVDCVEPDSANRAALRALGPATMAAIEEAASERYDFVYTINVLEHIADLDRHLDELHRVLRPSGRLFVFVPAFNLLWTSLDDEVEHVQRFTRRTLTAPLMRAGFEIQSWRYFDSLGFVAALTIRLLGRFLAFDYSSQTIGFYDKALLPISLLGDRVFSAIAGKNLIVVARKSDRRPQADHLHAA